MNFRKNSKIYVAGHRGLVGTAILNNLKQKGYTNFVTRTHDELDLTNQAAVYEFFEQEKPEVVILAAAKVGGIIANNNYRADFIYENLMIQNNVIHESYKHGVKKLVFLGSTCVYPKNAPQPMKEDALLTSELEYTNEPYAIAKIAGLKMCESYNIQYGTNFIAVMPTNLYGPNDNFDLEKSHVLPALIRKMHLAKCLENNLWDELVLDLQARPLPNIDTNKGRDCIIEGLAKYGIHYNTNNDVSVAIWGDGSPLREFLWSEDMADATVHIMEQIDFIQLIDNEKHIIDTQVNIGTGEEISIKDLAYIIKKIIKFGGRLYFDVEKPNGTPRKLTDVSKLHKLGWKHKVNLEKGINQLYTWYIANMRIK